jgi:uncharacterized protein YktB (UPF0637 family)
VNFHGFCTEDFQVFQIDGLDERMEAIREIIRPKFEWLGAHYAPILSVHTGEEMVYHIAKHARRTVNPPKDTWIAWAGNKRGYKMLPHFQLGLWETHLFLWFAVIYEAPAKGAIAEAMLEQLDEVMTTVPSHYVWSWDHTKPETVVHSSLTKEQLAGSLQRVIDVKKAELLCGIQLGPEDPILHQPEALLKRIEETFTTLSSLYQFSTIPTRS